MRTALRVLLALILRRPLELEGGFGTANHRFLLTPEGRILPIMQGGEKTPEEIAAEEEAERLAEEQRKAEEAEAEAEAKRKQEEAEKGPEFQGDFDAEKARRLITNERARAEKRLKKAQDEAAAAQAEADRLKQERETEQEKIVRERDESRVETERLRASSQRVTIDTAIRDAAAELDVPAKKIKRLVRLVDRNDLSIDADGEIDGATEAVEAVLAEFPEFKGAPIDPNDPTPPAPEPPGPNPDRKRKPKDELTTEQVRKLAKENPDEFNKLFDEEKIPKSALAGLNK